MPDLSSGYLFAWRHAAQVPEPLLRGGFNLAANLAWAKGGKGIRRLEHNYARVRPDLDRRALRKLARAGMRSYLRYFREAFTLQAATSAQIDARVRIEGLDNVRDVPEQGAAASLALAHCGNWDLAGAWASRHLGPTMTVAEKLEPPRLFEEFVAFRESLGIDVLGLGEPGVFRDLVAAARDGNRIVALLADRDLTHRGVEVDLCGHRARVAAGPATVALAADVPLIPTFIYYERLPQPRRRAAGTPWGVVLRFHPPVPVPEPNSALEPKARHRVQVAAMTQSWVDALSHDLRSHLEDWHMLQRVFVADLDPKRYARTQARAEESVRR